jgi:hypothetical protein
MVGWLANEFSLWGIHVQNWMPIALAIIVLWVVYVRAKRR